MVQEAHATQRNEEITVMSSEKTPSPWSKPIGKLGSEPPDRRTVGDIKQNADLTLIGVRNAWERVNDTGGLPLSVDSTYQAVTEQCEKFAVPWAKDLLFAADRSVGKDRYKYLAGIFQMLGLVSTEKREEIKRSLLWDAKKEAEVRKELETLRRAKA